MTSLNLGIGRSLVLQLDLRNNYRAIFVRLRGVKFEGDKTRSGYMWYVQGIQPNVPAHSTFIYRWFLRSRQLRGLVPVS